MGDRHADGRAVESAEALAHRSTRPTKTDDELLHGEAASALGTAATHGQMSPVGLRFLQRTAGNRAVASLIRQSPHGGRARAGERSISIQAKAAPDLEEKVKKLEISDREHTITEHLTNYFILQRDLGTILVALKTAALGRFKEATDTAYNKVAEPSGLAWLSLALSLVPEALAIVGAFKAAKEAGHYFATVGKEAHELSAGGSAAMEAAEDVKKIDETVKGGIEVVKGAREAGEGQEKRQAATEAEGRGNYIMSQINSLADVEIDNFRQIWKNQNQLTKDLMPLARKPSVDINAFLQKKLPLPGEVPPKDVNDRVSYRFEAYLLKDYFSTSWRLKKKSSRSYIEDAAMGEGSFDEWFDVWEWPENLMKHIEKEIEPLVPGAKELIFGPLYEQTAGQTRKREASEKQRRDQAREAQFNEGMEERLLGL